jgi:Tol biopolymer transport system component
LLSFGRGSSEKPDSDIYAIQAVGGAPIRLTDSPQVLKESAGWSPTANEFAYSAKLGNLSHVLEIVGTDGQPPRTVLTSALHFHGPQWSHDGRYISFTLGVGHGGSD